MNLLYIGAGFVGACSGAVSAVSGHNVLVYDVDDKRIAMLSSQDREIIESCLFEEGLGDLLVRNQERLRFVSDYAEVEGFLEKCDAVFMCLPTPEQGETGETDLSYYLSAAEKLAGLLNKRNKGGQDKHVLIINKSTVPINMSDRTADIMNAAGVKNYGVVANPEFLVEGKAVRGALKPDLLVVGAEKEQDFLIMRAIYQRFYSAPNVQYIEVNVREAAAGKLLYNYILFNKLAVCFDVIGRTCEAFPGLHFENIRKILASEPRIGNWGFYDSLYAGGSCFIKDARSLAYQLGHAGINTDLVSDTYFANKRQLESFIARAEKEADLKWQGKSVSLLGVAFKRDTNDIRNAPSIEVMNFLLKNGVTKVNVYDPAALLSFKKIFPESDQVHYYSHEFDAIKNTDVIIITTDWPQFRGLADVMIAELNNLPLIMDGRRMLQHRYLDLQKAGFKIIAVGSPIISRV